MVYDPDPPYTVRQTGAVDAATLHRFARFSRYWDMIANSGRLHLQECAHAGRTSKTPTVSGRLLTGKAPYLLVARVGFELWVMSV